MIRLDGKVAVITGVSRGIGEATARLFAAAGASVVLAARKAEGLQQVARGIEEAGGRALAVAAHAGKVEEIERLFEAAVGHFGKVDVLINNAGTNPWFGPMLEIEEGAWDKTFEVNLKGYFYGIRALARHLGQRGAPGAVVNVSSVTGLRAASMQGVYAMTKSAVISMTQTLAVELAGQRIRVNAIAPGLIETRLASALTSNPELMAQINARTPAGRPGQPQEIAGAALFLASDAASYVNGHTLVVDGGMTITGL